MSNEGETATSYNSPKEATPKETQSPTQSPVPKEATPPVSPVPKEGIPRPTLAVPDMTTISTPEPKVLYTPEAQLSIRKTTETNTPVKSKFDDISEKINNQNIPEITKTTTKLRCGCSIQ
jgi:hypothetical protein